jgi:hypothetical protein
MNYTQEELPRYELSKLNLNEINIEIGAYEKVIEFYEGYLLRKGEDVWVNQRLTRLYGRLSEYMIARELHIEVSK